MQRALGLAIAVAVAGAGAPAHSLTVDVSFVASIFTGFSGPDPTGVTPPQAEVTGSFTIDTATGVRDIPDFVTSSTQDELTYEVLNVYSTPTAGALEIAGYAYPEGDLASYLGFTNGTLDLVLVSGRASAYAKGDGPTCQIIGGPELPWSCAAAQITTAGTDDFLLVVGLPSILGSGEPPGFTYTTTANPEGGFSAGLVRVTLALDGGEPIELVNLPSELVEGAVSCFAARSLGDSAPLEGGAKPGGVLCEEPPGDASARAVGGPRSMREARMAAAQARQARVDAVIELRTVVGTHRLEAKRGDRMLLAASTGGSAFVSPPSDTDALRCTAVRTSRGSEPRRRVTVADPSGYRVALKLGRPTRTCVGAGDGGRGLLCYRARRLRNQPPPPKSDMWVAHALGVEHLRVGDAREVCLPATALE